MSLSPIGGNDFDINDDNDGMLTSDSSYEDFGQARQEISNSILSQVGGGKEYGFNLQSVVNAMVAGEMMDEIPSIERSITNTNVRLSAVSKLESLMEDLSKTTLNPLEMGLSPYQIVSSDQTDISVNQASGKQSTFVSPFTVDVTNIAKTNSWNFTIPKTSENTAITGSGTLSLSLGTGSATDITIPANSTLTSIAKLINDKDLGIKAFVVKQNDGCHLAINSENTGSDNEVNMTFTADPSSDELNNLFASKDEVQPAVDASYKINGIPIISSTNNITYEGVSIGLNKDNSTAVISTQVSTSQVEQSITGFVSNYNELLAAMNALNSDTPGKNYVGSLNNDDELKKVFADIKQIILSPLSNGHALRDLGINMNNDGSLQVNQGQLENALIEKPDIGDAIFATKMTSTYSLLEFTSYQKTDDIITNATLSGTYDVNITNAASSASFTAENAVTLDGSNNINLASDATLDITVQGETTPGAFDSQTKNADIAIQIPAGAYTETELATLVQSKINENKTVNDNNAQVTVTFENDHLKIVSNQVGSLTGFTINSATSSNVDSLGISAGDMKDYKGVNTHGTINGQYCLSDGYYIKAQNDTVAGNMASGAVVKYTGSATGAIGSITLSRGFSDQLNTLFEKLTKTDLISPDNNGILTKKINLYKDQLGTVKLTSLINKLKKAQGKQQKLANQFYQQYRFVNSILAEWSSNEKYIDSLLGNKKLD